MITETAMREQWWARNLRYFLHSQFQTCKNIRSTINFEISQSDSFWLFYCSYSQSPYLAGRGYFHTWETVSVILLGLQNKSYCVKHLYEQQHVYSHSLLMISKSIILPIIGNPRCHQGGNHTLEEAAKPTQAGKAVALASVVVDTHLFVSSTPMETSPPESFIWIPRRWTSTSSTGAPIAPVTDTPKVLDCGRPVAAVGEFHSASDGEEFGAFHLRAGSLVRWGSVLDCSPDTGHGAWQYSP